MTAPESRPFASARPVRVAAWLGCLLLALIASRGVWPVVPVEGDEQGVLFGVDGMVRGSSDLLARRYSYDVQPGSYQLLALFARISRTSAEPVFAVATIAGAVLFAVGSAWLLSLVVSLPFACALLAMLWCQETVAAACYLNTSALAGAVAIFSLVPFARGSRWPLLILGGVGLGCAGWLRGDALLVSPAALPLLSAKRGSIARALGETTLAAAAALTSFLLLREASDAPLREGLAAYGSLPHDVGTARTARDVLLTLLSPGLLALGVIGLGWLALRRAWTLLFLVLAGIVPTALAYHGALVTTKYLYYALPFALVPALALLRSLAIRCGAWRPAFRRCTLVGLGFAATADLVAGFRLLPEEARYFQPAPSWAAMPFPVVRPRGELHLGGGDVIPNEDGFRVRTGHLFASAAWHREKLHQQQQLALIRASLALGSDCTFHLAGWLPEQIISRELFLAGFVPRPDGRRTRWQRGMQIVDTCFVGSDEPSEPAGEAEPLMLGGNSYLINLYGGKAPPAELPDGRHWHALSLPTEGFITLYRRD
jgi:hypothetical protein